MIGLGSNRLSVCRRGGMRVTQAGRGGMEWLAGGRVPSWASPYSAQATAALKAQFPTQWPTIRDYGFAHPEIVGYMNAYAPEDAKIAYSLVEGIGTRWLDNGGTSYADTGYIGNTTIRWELDYMFLFKSGKTSNIQNGAGSPNDTARFSCAFVTNGKFNIAIGKGFNSATQNSEYGVRKHFVLDAYNHYGMIDDERLETGNTFVSSGANICIFTRNENGNTSSYLHYGRCVKSKIYQNGTLVQYLIPFKRNGQMELLDLVSGNLATRVGTFTELIS